jgi:hypothetical protein
MTVAEIHNRGYQLSMWIPGRKVQASFQLSDGCFAQDVFNFFGVVVYVIGGILSGFSKV